MMADVPTPELDRGIVPTPEQDQGIARDEMVLAALDFAAAQLHYKIEPNPRNAARLEDAEDTLNGAVVEYLKRIMAHLEARRG